MKTKLIIALSLMLAVISCGKRTPQPHSEEEALIMRFIIETYNSGAFEDYDFLEAHCSQSLLDQLAADYYDVEGGGYAVWEFRTMAQDSKSDDVCPHGVVTVTAEGDGWYAYEFFDGGFRGINRVKASLKDGVVVFEALERVYDETTVV